MVFYESVFITYMGLGSFGLVLTVFLRYSDVIVLVAGR